MEFITVSSRRYLDGVIDSYSSQDNEINNIRNLLADSGHWCSARRSSPAIEYVIIDLKDTVPFDSIEIYPSPKGTDAFPKTFRIESSIDKTSWEILHEERNYEPEEGCYHIEFPLIISRYVKILVLESNAAEFFTEIGRICVLLRGVESIEASSNSTAEGTAENLIDLKEGGFWESEHKSKTETESLTIDLGRIFQLNGFMMASADLGFPEHFFLETSTDGNLWTHVFEEKEFMAQAYTRYIWNIEIMPARFVRLEMKNRLSANKKHFVKLTRIEIYVAPSIRSHTHNIGQLTPYASIFQPGMVKLARDGETTPGSAIQANDRRLIDASTIFKGIVRLAEEGEKGPGLAVQASDPRLQEASELSYGIVRLCYDRENKPGTVVQGSDSRLQEANEKSFGIVRLCPDGMYNDRTVVQGNDSRLQKSSEDAYGIVRLARNGESTMNSVVQADDKRLRDATTKSKGIVEFAEDGENAPDVAVQGNDKRLRDASTKSKGIVELAEDGEDAPDVAVQGNDRRLKDASTTAKGIVELAEDGEDAPNVAVQGNDKRLRDASTTAKGIVELAEDGETSPNAAVQGNDRRLKDATTTAKGIVELAEDGETSPNVAVQGNDKRLKDASTKTKGIVELAEDGETSPNVAVQGSDKRLKDASTKTKGIVELAEDGEDAPDVAVQGNDRRLKDASTTAKGIVELAEDGETSPNVAVQGNDRRLKDASTTAKGIVELAEDGETSPNVAVQGSDRRLKDASQESNGIVRLAAHNEKRSGRVVQSDDPRLEDQRLPLPHDHEYAPLSHDFSSHSGTIRVRADKHETFLEITPPSDNSAVIYGHNESGVNGSIGVAGIAGLFDGETGAYGVVGHSRHVGVRGQSSGNDTVRGCGILGISRFGAGGVFASEHDYSLVADGFGAIEGYDGSLSLRGNGKALMVNGQSVFTGQLRIGAKKREDDQDHPSNIAEFFEVDDQEFISPGDLLVVHPSGGGVLARSRTAYNRSVVGVVSGNPVILLNNSGKTEKVYPVALSGRALCRVDAREKAVKPGDLIVTSSTPGCGMPGDLNSFERIGCVIGKALDSLDDGTGLIPIFIAHM